jgi:hypothetical protein
MPWSILQSPPPFILLPAQETPKSRRDSPQARLPSYYMISFKVYLSPFPNISPSSLLPSQIPPNNSQPSIHPSIHLKSKPRYRKLCPPAQRTPQSRGIRAHQLITLSVPFGRPSITHIGRDPGPSARNTRQAHSTLPIHLLPHSTQIQISNLTSRSFAKCTLLYRGDDFRVMAK